MAKHWIDGAKIIHCNPADGCDYFLCGAAMDGEDGNGTAKETPRRVNCPECIRIIKFCKTVRARELRVAAS